MHLFLSSTGHLERLLQVSDKLANGELRDLAHHLALSSLTPLAKGGGAVRPLALPDGLRRLVASTICEQARAEFAEVLAPLAVAVGVPAGRSRAPLPYRLVGFQLPCQPFFATDSARQGHAGL